jgi:hypothetical protein
MVTMLVALAGCATTSSAHPALKVVTRASAIRVLSWSGTAPAAPTSGAASVTVDRSLTVATEAETFGVEVYCTGTTFAFSSNPMSGAMPTGWTDNCGTPQSMTFPTDGTTNFQLQLTLTPGATWAVTVTPSVEKMTKDAALESDCDNLGAVESALTSAQSGVASGQTSTSQRTSIFESEAQKLDTLSNSSTTVLRPFFTAYASAVRAAAGNGQVQPVLDFASVCVQNDTPILVSSSNGG